MIAPQFMIMRVRLINSDSVAEPCFSKLYTIAAIYDDFGAKLRR